MGGAEKIKIPDWRIYKIDGITELEQTKDALAKRGLNWPWMRNEVWRYQNRHTARDFFSAKFVFKGFSLGAALMVATICIDKAFGISQSDDHGDHH